VTVGRDYVTNVNYSGVRTSGNAGRVRAVTVSVVASPLGEDLWHVSVHNGSSGPITDLAVEVYVVDDNGNRAAEQCVPAKSQQSLPQAMEGVMRQILQGGLHPFLEQAQMMSGGMPLAPYGNLAADHLTATFMPQIRERIQACMVDSFPSVLAVGDKAEVMYAAGGTGQVQADIGFADEDGNQWVRLHGQPPKPYE